jgi:hypothetical protein
MIPQLRDGGAEPSRKRSIKAYGQNLIDHTRAILNRRRPIENNAAISLMRAAPHLYGVSAINLWRDKHYSQKSPHQSGNGDPTHQSTPAIE